MRRYLPTVVLALAALLGSLAVGGAGPVGVVTAQSPDPTTEDTTVDGYDLVRPPSECIGFLPKPDCGREPASTGDRGGTMQYVTFGVILAGLAFIFTVVFRKVIQADRVKAAQADATRGNTTSDEDDPSRTPPLR